MPKVSAAHRAARREQILDATMRCLGRTGLAGLTMGDVIAEAGLSAGAVYTYFAGKDELIEGVGSALLDDVVGILETALATEEAPDPADIVGGVLVQVQSAGEEVGIDLAVVIVQVMSEAMLHGMRDWAVRRRILRANDLWIEIVRRQQAKGAIAAGLDPAYVARVLLSLVPGFVLQNRAVGPLDPQTYAETVRALLRPM